MQLGPRVTRTRGGRCVGVLQAGGARCPTGRPLLPSPARPTLLAALGPGGGKGPEDALKKLAQQAGRQANHLIQCLTPKQEGDLADVTLIFASTLIFMWLAASMYRLYAFSYYASGQHTIGTFWGN